MVTAIYPGTFDPITLGHLDIIERASKIFDRLIVSVVMNVEKTPMLEIDERVELIKKVVSANPKVEVDCSLELLADYAKQFENPVIIKGLRNSYDYEYETVMAAFNNKLNPQLETFFISASAKYIYLSSSAVRQLAMYGADLSEYVPEQVADALDQKLRNRR